MQLKVKYPFNSIDYKHHTEKMVLHLEPIVNHSLSNMLRFCNRFFKQLHNPFSLSTDFVIKGERWMTLSRQPAVCYFRFVYNYTRLKKIIERTRKNAGKNWKLEDFGIQLFSSLSLAPTTGSVDKKKSSGSGKRRGSTGILETINMLMILLEMPGAHTAFCKVELFCKFYQ
ncbi:hypothetical protein C0J52_05813 [Blattella germanica]|nr:hypothetical protein C0J52_05813 [Blattella germanica]